MISDGFHSLTDSASNIVGLAGARVSRKPPDEDHPYGHRKFETLAAGAIFVFLVLAVIEVLRAALSRLSGGGAAEVSRWSFTIMLVTIAINLLVVRYERREGRRLESELLLADALHTRSDVLTSSAVLISLAGVYLGFPLLDPVGGIVIAAFIAQSGYQIARETSHVLADRVGVEEAGVRDVVMSVPEVMGCHHIRSRGTADHVFLDLHVWFRGETTLMEAHRLSHVVKDRLLEAFPQIKDAIIHIEPPPSEIAEAAEGAEGAERRGGR